MITIILIMGTFTVMYELLPSELFQFQTDYETLTTQDKAVVSYFSANNLTVYTYTWSFALTYPDYAYNESGLPDDNLIEFYWKNRVGLGEYKIFEVKHAYPSVFGSWWLWSKIMFVQEPYLTKMGAADQPDYDALGATIDKTQLLRLSDNGNSSYFEVADDQITQNFIVMNPGTYASLSAAYDAGDLIVLSSYEVDFDAMKPNAFWLLAQLVFFQNPDFGLPGDLGSVAGYGIALAFWITIALLVYTFVTRLIPTIQGGIEN